MLSDFKNFVNRNKDPRTNQWFSVKDYKTEIFWILTTILVSLVSFGAGYLTVSKNNRPAIIIQNPPAASVQQGIAPSAEEKSTSDFRQEPATKEQQELKNNAGPTKKQGQFVGSVNGNKYHLPDCSSAKKIILQNQIWFNSEEEAQKAGYVKCGNCGKR